MRERDAQLNGTIVVEGEVVDDQGHSLSGVTVDVDRFVASGWEGKSFQAKETVDGRFTLTFRNSAYVLLRFRRPGYHWEEFRFRFAESFSSGPVTKKERTFPNVRVVLAKTGTLAQLHDYRVRLTWASSGTLSVWEISAVGATRSSPVVKEVSRDELVTLQETIYADVVATPNPVPALTDTNGFVLCPESSLVRILAVASADTGFLFVPVPNAETGPDRPLRELKEAPETGYTASLDFGADRIRDMVEGRVHLCFYFRLRGLHGKGEVQSAVFRKDRTLEVRAVFRLQPDGSRNVETTQ